MISFSRETLTNKRITSLTSDHFIQTWLFPSSSKSTACQTKTVPLLGSFSWSVNSNSAVVLQTHKDYNNNHNNNNKENRIQVFFLRIKTKQSSGNNTLNWTKHNRNNHRNKSGIRFKCPINHTGSPWDDIKNKVKVTEIQNCSYPLLWKFLPH